MSLRFVPIGVGDAFSERHYSSAVAIEADGAWLLVDCPHPLRKILKEASERSGAVIDPRGFEAVVLTHLHGDHVAGLEGLGWWQRHVAGGKPRVAAHPLVLDRLWSGRLAGAMDSEGLGLHDFFDTATLDDARPVRIGPFEIECRRTRHPVPTFALRVTAGGRTLGLSADTGWDPALLDWLCEADLVIHETGPGIHTPYAELAALPEATRKKLRLIHYPDDLDASDGRVELLVQGKPYTV